MANLNKVMLIGNLTRDVEVRSVPSGSRVGEFGLAVNRSWTDKSGAKGEETTFIDLVVWDKYADILQQYTSKGDPLFVEGRLQLDTWEDKETGAKRSKIRMVVEGFQFLGGKKKESTGDSWGNPPAGAAQPQAQPECRNKRIKEGKPGGGTCAICTTGPCQVPAYAKDRVEEDNIPF